MRYKSHNNLLRYFIEPHHQLPAAYVASCERFFKSLKDQGPSYKRQASSCKRQAASLTNKIK